MKTVIDRREIILRAGIEMLREEGLSGFTQPKIAKRAGIRQSHLTYYFPTLLNLLTAVARMAITAQLAAVDVMFESAASASKASEGIARVIGEHRNTRVLMGLAQAADWEPELRKLFMELSDGIVARAGVLLKRLNLPATGEHADMLHALTVGLAVIDLATSRPAGKARSQAALNAAFRKMSK